MDQVRPNLGPSWTPGGQIGPVKRRSDQGFRENRLFAAKSGPRSPKRPPERAKRGQERPKIGPRAAEEPPRVAQEAPRSGPGTARERPGAAQGPRCRRGGPRRAQRGPQEAPKRAKRVPRAALKRAQENNIRGEKTTGDKGDGAHQHASTSCQKVFSRPRKPLSLDPRPTSFVHLMHGSTLVYIYILFLIFFCISQIFQILKKEVL